MNEAPSLSIITTTDPQTKQLPLLLKALSDLANEEGGIYEVVIVDDLNQWKNEPPPSDSAYPGLKVTTLKPLEKLGQLGAILAGIKMAKSRILLTIDPDLYPCVPEIPRMTSMINNQTLAVHAIRQSRPDTSIFRVAGSKVVNFMVRRLTGLKVEDIGSPITLFEREALKFFDEEQTKKNINPRLLCYIKLGDRLATYRLEREPEYKKGSHYKLGALIITGWNLIKNAYSMRRERP